MTTNGANNRPKNLHAFKVMNDRFYTTDHYMILTAVFYGDKHHGYAIHKHINDDLGYELNQSTMYRKIHEMIQRGYLSIPRVDKNRKIYKITDYGVEYLVAIIDDVKRLFGISVESYNCSVRDGSLGVEIDAY